MDITTVLTTAQTTATTNVTAAIAAVIGLAAIGFGASMILSWIRK